MMSPTNSGARGSLSNPHLGTVAPLPFGSGVGLGGKPTQGSPSSGSQAGGLNFETIAEITSATDISATNPNEYLVGLYLRAGANNSGWFAVLYDTVNTAILPVPALAPVEVTGAKGLPLYLFYPFNMKFTGTKAIASGTQTFGGGLAGVTAVFSNQPNPSPGAITNWNQLRAVAVTGNETGTGGTAKTYTMPGGQSIAPIAITAMCANESGSLSAVGYGSINFPAVTPFAAYSVPCEGPYNLPVAPRRSPIPAIGPATSYSLTHKAGSLGGTTDLSITGILWLPPA